MKQKYKPTFEIIYQFETETFLEFLAIKKDEFIDKMLAAKRPDGYIQMLILIN